MEMTATATLRAATKWQRRKVTRAKSRVRETIIARERRHMRIRNRLASQHLSGSGLEIGALHYPLRVPRHASVRYVDRFAVPQLREHYPELDGCDLVRPHIIDDGERLTTVADESVDFVIANHMIEHCEDPIGALKSHLRVLRPGGVIYMAVPDCRFTFDRDREITPLEHLRRDHLEGPEWSRREHYEQWARFVDQAPAAEVASRAEELEQRRYSIHFHVWTPDAFLELLCACQTELGLPLEVDALERNDHEFILILSRERPRA
jgi:SAM-dependent methyltransferase